MSRRRLPDPLEAAVVCIEAIGDKDEVTTLPQALEYLSAARAHLRRLEKALRRQALADGALISRLPYPTKEDR